MSDETQNGPKRDWSRATPGEEIRVILSGGDRQIVGTLVNISHSGLLVACDPAPAVDTKLTIDFEAADHTVTAKGHVVRVSEDPPGVALHLDGVLLEDRMSIEALLERAGRAL